MKKTLILIVEDEIVVAKDIEQILVAAGYDVLGIASSYDKALRMLQASHPDLILCDINLGGDKTGIDLMAECPQSQGIPYLFISAYTDLAATKLTDTLSPANFLSKPFNEQQLLTAIGLVLLGNVAAE